MPDQSDEQVALFRFAVIAACVSSRLTPAERGRMVRELSLIAHPHPDGAARVYSRGTIDRWIRAYRSGGLEALRPERRADTGAVRRHPELLDEAAALRREVPERSAASIAAILLARHGIAVSERTVRQHLRRRGLDRRTLTAEARVFGRYEAPAPNDRWITDVLHGPFVPHPKVAGSRRAKLFLVVDDHSRLLVHGRFCFEEDTRAAQRVLREAILRRGVPDQLYADQGAPFTARALVRSCAVLGIALIHSRPYSPEGRGKQERLNRYIRERFILEAEAAGIADLAELNDRFIAWAESVANTRVHAETHARPIDRFTAGGPPRAVDDVRLRDAFRWSETRLVSRTATVSLAGNRYQVDPSLVGRRVELRFDPEDLSVLSVYLEGADAGLALPLVIGRHVHPAAPARPSEPPEPTGVDYLGLVLEAHTEESTGPIGYRFLSAPEELDDEEGPR